jgi:hypothetical protein
MSDTGEIWGSFHKEEKMQNNVSKRGEGVGGSRYYVRLDVVPQFKTDLVQRLEGLVFEEKKFLT